MDLRRKLLLYLSGFFVALFVVAVLLVAAALRKDVAEEVKASTRLVELLLSVGSDGAVVTDELLAGRFRHISVSAGGANAAPLPERGPAGVVDQLADWLGGIAAGATVERRLEVGGETLVIRADPRSEIAEILHDATRLLAVLAAFSVLTVVAVWYAVGRALAPVRALEARLEHIGRGQLDAPPQHFDLPEFSLISHAIDRLAANLAYSRASERRLTRQLITLQESERRDIARELHDEFGQSLTAIGVAAAFIERHAGGATSAVVDSARDIRGEASRVVSHVRELLTRLRPHGLEGMSMLATLRDYARGWAERAPGVALTVALPDELPPLSEDAALALYRTLQEALTNVLRHSRATRVGVSLAVTEGRVCLRVADNGVGRAEELLRAPRVGLTGMRERAELAGGRLRVEDAPEAGVTIALSIPTDEKPRGSCDDPDPAA